MTMKSNIKLVEIYEKPRCPNCIKMRKVFDRWHDENPNVDFQVLSINENRDYMVERGVLSAPCFRIISTTGDEQFISGDNPDMLMDALNGSDDLWDF